MERPAGEGQVILVAEDDQSLIHFLRRSLENEGFKPTIVQTGQETLKLASVINPAIIVLDVGLPDTDGFAVCKQLKSDNRVSDIPVLFLTGHTDIDDRVTGLNLGAQDYLMKPFEMPEFLARVRAVLRSHAETNQKRQELTQQHEELMAVINDELRRPLTIISMASQILDENHQISEGRRDQLISSIRGSAGTLTHIIDDLLYLAQPTRRLRSSQPRALLLSIAEASRARVQDHDLHLITRVPLELPPIALDETLFRRAVGHLIDNAIKFTPRGGVITITAVVAEGGQITRGAAGLETGAPIPADLLPPGDPSPWLLIAVRDTGIGIAPEHHARVFEPFFQVDSSSVRTAQGVGLGLAVVATFVRSHHGQLSVRSGNSLGTEIYLALPLRQPPDDYQESLGDINDGPASA
ncbi:MAG: hybrid sensor histidine kinase/response regulator [Ktedonobacterales bacterium]|nr:hybrid sensor histidine kinase/response regulator [Ktedonobacterales bacterium]